MSGAHGTLAARFWPKVDLSNPRGCWTWTAAQNVGYGVIGHGGRGRGNVLAHRFAYEALVGPIPPGMTLDHYRLNPGPRMNVCSRLCVNPAHLEPVTTGDNTRRGNLAIVTRARMHAITQCVAGHPLGGDNVYFSRGRRNCRACGRRRMRTYMTSKRKK